MAAVGTNFWDCRPYVRQRAEINVDTFKGVVQLSGFVSSSVAENKAIEITCSVKGVKSAKNDMRAR